MEEKHFVGMHRQFSTTDSTETKKDCVGWICHITFKAGSHIQVGVWKTKDFVSYDHVVVEPSASSLITSHCKRVYCYYWFMFMWSSENTQTPSFSDLNMDDYRDL